MREFPCFNSLAFAYCGVADFLTVEQTLKLCAELLVVSTFISLV